MKPLRWADLESDLQALHRAALAAADPEAAVARHLSLEGGVLRAGASAISLEPGARVWLVAFGKASPGMARAAVRALGDRLTAGVVAHPHAAKTDGEWPATLRFFPAGHPMPDEGSLSAGDAVVRLLGDARPADLALVLVSGGGSALLESLRPGISLADLRETTQSLQRAGADIVDLNVVRRALSRLKGGGLARLAHPARVVALLLSDVMGDRPDTIASGPTVPSPTGPQEALAVLERHGLSAALPVVMESLRAGAREPSRGAEAAGSAIVLVGSNRMAAEALRQEAEARGFRAMILTDYLQGEAREAGRLIGGLARSVREAGLPIAPPACLVLGGETTVTVRGSGRGGRNLELTLGAALSIAGCPRTAVFSFATDGVDGSSAAAGAVATGETLEKARAAGLSPHASLAENDTEAFFRSLGSLWTTGPSGTNVNDLTVAIVYP